MDRPPARLLQKRLKCAAGVTEAAAMEACEDAIRESGFVVATRSEHYVVLLPCASMSWIRCLAPGQSQVPSQDPGAGRGVTVEFTLGGAEGGRLLVSVAAPRAGKGKAFLGELRCRLKVAAHRAKIAGFRMGHKDVQQEELAENALLRDSSVYYHVSRLLCSRRTAAGNIAADFIEEFNARWSGASSEPPAVPGTAPMAECRQLVHRLLRALQDTWGDAATTEAVGPAPPAPTETRLRSCIERCLYTRLGPALWRVYSGLHEAEDAHFANRAAGPRAAGDTTLLQALEVREVFHGAIASAKSRLKGDLAAEDDLTEATRSTAAGSEDEAQGAHGAAVEEENLDSNTGDFCDDGSSSGAIGAEAESAIIGRSVYQRAASALSRVQDLLIAGNTGTPREAVEALALAQLEMRTCALEASGGQVELLAMEDTLPIFIFVLLRSSVTRPFTCARIMSDTLTPEEKLSSEGKAVALLDSAARYVAEEWERFCGDGL